MGSDNHSLTPAQLDAVEDALEHLHAGRPISATDDVVAATLTAYQRVLEASKDALPSMDPPKDLAQTVLARAAAQAPPEAIAVVRVSKFRAFRRAWLWPTIAISGAAALVFLLVPGSLDDADPALLSPTMHSAQDAAVHPSEGPAAMQEQPPMALKNLGADKDAASKEDAGQGDEVVDEESTPFQPAKALRRARSTSTTPARKTSGMSGGGNKVPSSLSVVLDDDDAASEAPARPPVAEDSQRAGSDWAWVRRGDALRTHNNCKDAVGWYRLALASNEPDVRSAAHRGLAACGQPVGAAGGAPDVRTDNKASAKEADAAYSGQ